MKIWLFILTAAFSLGSLGRASALSTQFIFGVPSHRVRLHTDAYDPVSLLDDYDYPAQGFYHYYSLPGLRGETNYNPFDYSTPMQIQSSLQYDFPQEGNFVY